MSGERRGLIGWAGCPGVWSAPQTGLSQFTLNSQLLQVLVEHHPHTVTILNSPQKNETITLQHLPNPLAAFPSCSRVSTVITGIYLHQLSDFLFFFLQSFLTNLVEILSFGWPSLHSNFPSPRRRALSTLKRSQPHPRIVLNITPGRHVHQIPRYIQQIRTKLLLRLDPWAAMRTNSTSQKRT